MLFYVIEILALLGSNLPGTLLPLLKKIKRDLWHVVAHQYLEIMKRLDPDFDESSDIFLIRAILAVEPTRFPDIPVHAELKSLDRLWYLDCFLLQALRKGASDEEAAKYFEACGANYLSLETVDQKLFLALRMKGLSDMHKIPTPYFTVIKEDISSYQISGEVENWPEDEMVLSEDKNFHEILVDQLLIQTRFTDQVRRLLVQLINK